VPVYEPWRYLDVLSVSRLSAIHDFSKPGLRLAQGCALTALSLFAGEPTSHCPKAVHVGRVRIRLRTVKFPGSHPITSHRQSEATSNTRAVLVEAPNRRTDHVPRGLDE
jgi:hypothetical protein